MNSKNHSSTNLSLKGAAAIQIGIYFILAVYVIETLVSGFLVDDNPAGMLSVELIEVFGIFIYFLTFILVALALYFKGKRSVKGSTSIFWNKSTKKTVSIVISSFFATSFIVLTALNLGYANKITPVFLICYGAMLFAILKKERKGLAIVAGLSLFLAIYCLIIPNYWYSALLIFGIAHITYGIMVKN